MVSSNEIMKSGADAWESEFNLGCVRFENYLVHLVAAVREEFGYLALES